MVRPVFSTGEFKYWFPINKDKEQSLLSKVWEVFKRILFCIVAIALFATAATFFAIGFVIGIVWSKKTQKVIDKVNLIWQTQPVGVIMITGVGAFLALPVTWCSGALFTGAYLGTKLYQTAKAIKHSS